MRQRRAFFGSTGQPFPLVDTFPLANRVRGLRPGLKGEPLARWADHVSIATCFPRALAWAGRTAPLRGNRAFTAEQKWNVAITSIPSHSAQPSHGRVALVPRPGLP